MSDMSRSVDLSQLSPYERKAWDAIEEWQNSPVSGRHIIPPAARKMAVQAGRGAANAWREVPGSAHLNETLATVLDGGNRAINDLAAASLQRDRILDSARRKGVHVDDLSDLRKLDLQVVDQMCPGLNIRYASASAATGAWSGFIAGGGTAAVFGTAGVAAAPGGLAVGGALTADVIATIGLAVRSAAHYATYFGYDVREEEEKAVLLAVVGVGFAGKGAAKQAAMLHVRQVAMMVARRAAWKELGEEAIVKLIQALFTKLSVNLTKRKLAQALPVAGIALGAGFNYSVMRKVGTASYFAYRERFLIEKYGLRLDEPELDVLEMIGSTGVEDVSEM